MVLQFVGEYVVAFLRKTRCENNGFFVLFKVQHSLFNIQNSKRLNVEYHKMSGRTPACRSTCRRHGRQVLLPLGQFSKAYYFIGCFFKDIS
jgi:hypothetical protein